MDDRQEWLQHAYNALCGAIGSLKMIREAFDDDLSNIAMDIESARSRLSPIAHPEERHSDGLATGGVISKEVAQEIGRSIGQHSCVVEQWGAECEEFGCHDDGADT